MKRTFFLLFFASSLSGLYAQRVTEIYVHLYTDSLKKGTYNYINIDGKMSDGSWKPLTSKELTFTTDYGKFEGNSLVLPDHPAVKKVTVTATLKADTALSKTFQIGIKQLPDPPLPENTQEAYRSRTRKQ
ncbi:hypothetical protein A8C56_15495 [Niabella ginsenosidivorans]|uniref:Uncharacterized protein n=1 Tax=Niabella ginsenosidivorans TaxID=1176587 RepID=A0A1A9I6L9_9BACT|nr:hypothetical protein [Niabella ginsenosidivorans]ANH82184.1 hypothetical protein A8C56_15495 [Niabella ginsenosidivorans]